MDNKNPQIKNYESLWKIMNILYTLDQKNEIVIHPRPSVRPFMKYPQVIAQLI